MSKINKSKIPDFQSIMLPLLKILEDGQPKSINDVIKILANQFNLNEQDLKIKVPSGQMGLFRNRVGWTRSYLKKAGLIRYPERGVYQITDFGKKYLAKGPMIFIPLICCRKYLIQGFMK